MQTPEIEHEQQQEQHASAYGLLLGVVSIPFILALACLAIPYIILLNWWRQHREHTLRLRMREQGRLINWQEFLRHLRERGGTCIEEKFSPKGPVRFWWTAEDVGRQSPYTIIDWFTMRKGRQHEPFIRWCRSRYTDAAGGSALLVDATMVPRREIYTLWAECRSGARKARWIEVAPPEILPRRPGLER
jgi:hypothetical protein